MVGACKYAHTRSCTLPGPFHILKREYQVVVRQIYLIPVGSVGTPVGRNTPADGQKLVAQLVERTPWHNRHKLFHSALTTANAAVKLRQSPLIGQCGGKVIDPRRNTETVVDWT
jgi:hypothetical protein